MALYHCTIFKTTATELNGAINQIGIFSKSLADLKNAIIIKNIDGNIRNGIGGLFNNFSSVITTKDLANIREYNRLVGEEGITSQTAWNRTMLSSSKSAQALFDDENNLIKSGNGLVLSENSIINATNTMSFSAKAGKIALQGLALAGNILTFMAISKGIELAIKGIDHLIHSSEYAEKAFQASTESAKSFSQTVKDIQKNTVDKESDVNSITKRYAELSQGINSFTNENKVLSTDEYEEFLDLNEQLAGLFPSLTRDYDENGNAILKLSGSVDSVIESIKALLDQEKELAKTKIRENIEQYFDGTDETDGAWRVLEGRKQTLDNANKELESLTNTYYELMNSDKEISLGHFHKNLVNEKKNAYINFIKSYFGEDIAEAVNNAVSTHLGLGFGGEFSNLAIDFSKLELSDSQKELITKSYDTFYSELLAKCKTAQSEFDAQNTEFSNNAMFWLEDLSFYKESNKYIQTAIQNLVSSVDWSNYNTENLNYDGVKRILQDSILTPFQIACNDPKAKNSLDNALTSLFTMNTSEMSANNIAKQVNSYINTIAEIINKSPLDLKIRLGFENVDTIAQNYREVTNKAAEKFSKQPVTNLLYGGKLYDAEYLAEREAIEKFAEENSINTQNEIAFWNQCIEESDTREEAMERYLKSSFTDSGQVFLSISDTIDQLNTQLKPAFDSLQSAYKSIFTDNGEFALNSIDILSTCDTIKSKLDELNEMESITVDYTSFEDFVTVLRNAEATKQDVETAFDSLATSITQATLTGIEDFETMKAALEDLGIVNSEMTAFDALIRNTEALKEAGLDLADAEDEDIQVFTNAIVSTENYEKALNLLRIQKILCAENPLSSTADIQNLYQLAQAAGIAINAIQTLAALNAAYTEASANGDTIAATAAKGQMEFIKQQVIDQFAHLGTEIDFNRIGGGIPAASSAGASAGKSYIEAFEEELKALEELRDSGLISEKQYLDRLRLLYERYFKDKAGYEKEYARYKRQYIDGYKSLYESVFSHASGLIDEQIDGIQDEKDAAVSALEAQKKAAEDSYNAQIKLLEDKKDALQDEIDKIREANEDRKEAIRLQEKERNLARAENQKTILQYTEGRGFFYTADTDAIRDARNELDDAKAEAGIRVLEKQQDALDKQIDSIQELLEATGDYWDSQIEQTEKYYDTLIRGMEDYKGKWDSLSGLQEHAQMLSLLRELGYTEADLLNQNSGALESLMTSYLGILKDMSNNDTGILSGLTLLTGRNMDTIPSFLEQTIQDINGISDALAGEEEGAGVTGAVQKVMDKIGTADSGEENTDTLRSTLKTQTDAALDEETGIPAQTTAWENMNGPLVQASDTVSNLSAALDEMNGKEYSITLNITGNGSALNMIGSTAAASQQFISRYQTGSTQTKAEKTEAASENRTPAKAGTGREKDSMARAAGASRAAISAIPARYIPLAEDDPFMITQKKVEAYFEENGGITAAADLAANAVKQSFEGSHLNLSNINTNVNRSVTQNFKSVNLSCPNVTNSSGVEYIQKALGNLSSRALQDAMKAY